MEKAIVKTSKAFESKVLTRATARIDKLNDDIRANLFEIAHVIAEVKANEDYKSDYANIGEWAKECFGYEKSLTYNLAKIGSEYTVAVLNEKGKTVGYRSNLVESGNDYTTTQITKMLPAGHDIAKELHDNGVISPEMSVREIETAIKNATAPESNEEESDVTDEIENENAEEKDAMDAFPFVSIPKEMLLNLIQIIDNNAKYISDEDLDIINEARAYLK